MARESEILDSCFNLIFEEVQDQSDSNNQFGHNMTIDKGNKEEEGQLRTKQVEDNLDVPEILETSKKVFYVKFE